MSTLTFDNECFKIIYVDGSVTNYAISSTGRFINYKRKKELKKSIQSRGYELVTLNLGEGIFKQFLVHRLVAEAFIPNPKGLPVINHKDEVKVNNNILNLEWCSYQYNSEYSVSRTFLVTTPEGTTEEVTNMERFCRDNSDLKLDPSAMIKVARGKQVKHKGFKVEYK